MNNNKKRNVRSPELIQFVRGKGKLVPEILGNGDFARDERGKVKMIREKGLPRGVLVAGMVNGEVRIGWSYVNKKMDRFNKELGMKIAMGRMLTPSTIERVPHKVMKDLENSFIPRCENYFGITID